MKKQTISFISSITIVLFFVAFLFTGMVATILREKETYSYFENRNLAVMPEFTVDGVLDGTYFSEVDTYVKEHSAGRTTLLKANTYIDMNILCRPVVNDVVMTEDVLLPWNNYEILDNAAIEYSANIIATNLKSHSDLTESYGGQFYYVAVPCQYVCYENSYPWYLNNRSEYTDASTAALFGKLEKLNVNYIDMLEYYESAGKPETFSSTIDNHFSIYGAYDTYIEIMKRINADTDYALDVLDKDEFTVETLPNPYLGSRPRKLFGMWSSDERLSTITPINAPAYERWNYNSQGAPIVYALPQNPWESVLYTMYMGGDIANTVIDTNRDELPSILIYGDSFTNAVECVAWYSFDTMYTLDFRHYGQMSLEAFINEHKPDIVVCIRDYEALLLTTGNGQ